MRAFRYTRVFGVIKSYKNKVCVCFRLLSSFALSYKVYLKVITVDVKKKEEWIHAEISVVVEHTNVHAPKGRPVIGNSLISTKISQFLIKSGLLSFS